MFADYSITSAKHFIAIKRSGLFHFIQFSQLLRSAQMICPHIYALLSLPLRMTYTNYASGAKGATSTEAVHAGEQRFRAHHSLTVPIVQTAVYTFANTDALVSYTEEHMFWDEPEREEYGRYGNPTVRAAEAKIAAL